jgi:hypothetical protein
MSLTVDICTSSFSFELIRLTATFRTYLSGMPLKFESVLKLPTILFFWAQMAGMTPAFKTFGNKKPDLIWIQV